MTDPAARATLLRRPADRARCSAMHRVETCGAGRRAADAKSNAHLEHCVQFTCLPECSADPARLAGSGVAELAGLLEHEVAANTVRSYRSQWKLFQSWASRRGVPAVPADPNDVAVYLAERIEELGHRPATLRAAAAAIGFVHRAEGQRNPCEQLEVKRTLRGATRKAGREQKQAKGLTADGLAAIRATACIRRPGRGGGLESADAAERRGRLDIALVSLMRDAMLRVSEAASLTWTEIETQPDSTGRLLVRRSKTDPEGSGFVAFLSTQTMAALQEIRHGAAEDRSVFGLRPNQISTRIKRAAAAAGLGDGFSGHSPRVGMAQDLARAGIELPSLMTAGRWRTPTMPAHYTRNETAGRGAVAQFYGGPATRAPAPAPAHPSRRCRRQHAPSE
ncbi:MAG: tyrosine-type recombinase/integrase [Rhodospirillales bacterium]|nr:tyrosine-type recombinase/integrase [Rhodospirillales bacterium]